MSGIHPTKIRTESYAENSQIPVKKLLKFVLPFVMIIMGKMVTGQDDHGHEKNEDGRMYNYRITQIHNYKIHKYTTTKIQKCTNPQGSSG